MKATTDDKELFTGGEWKQGTNTTSKQWMQIFSGRKVVAEIMPINRVGQRQKGDFEEENANASLIAESKNMYYIIKRLLPFISDNVSYELLNQLQDTPEKAVFEAEEILNRINKQ